MRVFTGAILFILAFGGAIPAQAQFLDQKAYVEVRGGLHYLTDSDITTPGLPTIEASYDEGGIVGEMAVGGILPEGWRYEVAASWRKADIDEASSGGLVLPFDGDVQAVALMLNGYYDFGKGAFKPYIGVGIGAAYIAVDASTLGVQVIDDEDVVFAYQVGAGLSYAVSQQIDLTLGYTLFGTSDASLSSTAGDPIEADYLSHNVMAGLRFGF